ncbi:MAG: PIG-L family deacetylase [Ruminococcaceae bacterium]|nr:PIG-L family deacetylase [Oscillospiraceae bacterium]
MTYLLVVAHPDDEVLGAGATIHKLTQQGHTVHACILSAEVTARAHRPEDDELASDIAASSALIGISHRYCGSFPNIQLNNVPHLQLVQFIEKAIIESGADVIITHHPSDTNNDHLHTSLACQAALRLFQRRTDIKPISELWFMEVLSSSEWNINPAAMGFVPNMFVEIGKEGIEKKIAALALYRGVMRPYPHPRSDEALRGLALYRGAQAGVDHAEAFQCGFRRIAD